MLKYLFSFFIICTQVEACTRIYCNHDSAHLRFARTLDLFVDDQPQLIIYPRGISRNGQAGENEKKWKSKYGSAVVTAFHKGFVTDGLNEAGLGAHLLFLEQGAFQQRSGDKATLSSFYLAQYLLDTCKTVKEALKQLAQCLVVGVKLAGQEWPLQLALEDLYGDSAVVEFVEGNIVCHQGPQYRVVASSDCYEAQLNKLKTFKPFGGEQPLPGGVDPLSRFVRASTFLEWLPKAQDEKEGAAAMLSLIRTAQIPVGAPEWETRWITVGDLTAGVLYFEGKTNVRIDLKQYNLAEGGPIYP